MNLFSLHSLAALLVIGLLVAVMWYWLEGLPGTPRRPGSAAASCVAGMLAMCIVVVLSSCTRPDKDIAGTCVAIAGAETGLDVRVKGGHVSKANYDHAMKWVARKNATCEVKPQPTSLSPSEWAVLIQVAPVLTAAAAGKDIQDPPPIAP